MKVDHFILGVPDLDVATKKFANLSGINPVFGGTHPTLSTHNALVSLGDCYLELIAAVPGKTPGIERLNGITAPRLIGWAIEYFNTEEVRSVFNGHGINLSTPSFGSRVQPNGIKVGYEYMDVEGLAELGCPVVPFLVRWISSTHPSVSSPVGCSLVEFSMKHPKSEIFDKLLKEMNMEIKHIDGNQSDLKIVVETPRSRMVLPADMEK